MSGAGASSWYDTVKESIIPTIAGTSVVWLFRLLPYFKLVPLTRWRWDDETAFPVLLPAFVGAAIGSLKPAKAASNTTKAVAIGVSGLLGLVLPFSYNSITADPPTEANTILYGWGSFLLFILTYFFLAYALVNVGKVLAKK